MKTTSIDRQGNLAVIGSFNFEGSLLELRNMIDEVIKEHGEDTKCKIHIIIKK